MSARYLILTFLSLFFVGCFPVESTRQIQEATNNLGDSNTQDPVADGNYEAPYWFDNGSKKTSVTLNFDNKKNHYLFGSDVDSYLSTGTNFQQTYCLLAPFTTGSVPSKPLMVRATPATTIDYSTGKRNRYFRVNLSSDAGNDFCNKGAREGVSSPNIFFSSLAYKTQDVCPTCLNIITSSQITLYKYMNVAGDEHLLKVNLEEIPYGALSLRIDINSSGPITPPSCTDAGCAAEGFDCCVNGQCVNEASVKTGAVQSDPQAFALAELEKATDPKWYLKYPEFYYICLEDPQNGGGDGPLDPADPDGEAQERLEKMIADYHCVEELKSNSQASPFHTDPIDETLPASAYQQCNIADSSEYLFYENVMKRLYTNCGCAETSNLSSMVANCPAYTYKLVYQQDALGNPTGDVTSVACVTPPNHDNDLPFQDLEVMVNSRSAPHRFFNEDGAELDPYTPASISGSTTQEGEPFQYLDTDKLFPLNGAFNMNSLLGQMNVSLDKARPARKIDLEFDKVYYIAVLEGSYSACPSCGKDSWFTNFSPYPTTQQGLGIRASGFTTSRDSWGTNSSFANYEDAIFGRACWVPPTMLPFSHSADSDSQDQRLTRLKTQAAMYVNGYQRDWFGFNKGALIGSFDGVTWFAIGKGRKVRATSDRLYLAINAPFADLASPTDHIVSVQEYDFITTAADYDYNPEEEINSPFQNEAGLCQKYHECETDSHCISKLGWEYSCVDVYQYRTQWPKFNPTDAQELANDSRSGALVEFLQQAELPPGSSSKRCVYRGAGSPCRVDIENVADTNTRRALACAPNFYCASVSSSDFNKEVARFGAPLESILDSKNHFIGQDANVLGRPKDYVITSGGNVLPSDVKSAINANLALTDPSAASFGLCRPAKALPAQGAALATTRADQLQQHKIKDSLARTDFISQIAGCNSSLYTSLRYSSCPMLDSEGNYLHLSDAYVNIGAGSEVVVEDSFRSWIFDDREGITKYYSTQQNMCGLEAIDKSVHSVYGLNEEQLRSKSAFRTIEARSLSSADVQIEPTLAQNACFRRAGSVCHTNYDCSPNYKHYEVIDLLHPDVFGNTAEKKFWEEYLVCSQEKREPILTGDSDPAQLEAFNSYSMHNNRCCREVGKGLTLYTEDSPNAPESNGLRTDVYGGFQPNNPKRYSRYVSSLPQVNDTSLEGESSVLYTSRVSAKRPNDPSLAAGDPTILTKNQWKNIHDSAARTCCGGSWVRKFADGTNDWSRNRLNMDVSNFKCLNYKTPLMLTDDPSAYYLSDSELSKDRVNFCVDSGLNAAGCAQNNIAGISDFTTKQPILNTISGWMRIDTDPEVMKNLWDDNEWSFMQLLSLDSHPDAPYFNWTMPREDVVDEQMARQTIFTRIPAFIPFQDISDIRIDMESPSSNSELHAPGGSCTRLVPPLGYNCAVNSNAWYGACEPTGTTWTSPASATPENECYYMYDDATRRLKVLYHQTVIDDDTYYDNKAHSLIIEFRAPGTLAWEMDTNNVPAAAGAGDPAYLAHRRSSEPGNALYYLEKLAKLEYIGIPQMTYEPIFCNDIYQKVMPGVFVDNIKSAEDFINFDKEGDGIVDTFTDPDADTYWKVNGAPPARLNPEVYWSANDRKKVADQKLLAHEQIFSDNEFKCCLPLGAELSSSESPSICCSGARKEYEAGYADDSNLSNNQARYKCALPQGTDLNVYFNKFVSGEGLSDEYLTSAQPLSVEDFDAKTGAPKTNSAVLGKLSAIGKELCASGEVTRGGAFGPFQPEPVGNYIPQDSDPVDLNTFVDSVYDNGNINNRNVGYGMFQQGYRWNHHVYCAPGDE